MNQDVIVGSVESSPSLNRYAYVEGNPVNYLDPFGLEKVLYDSSELHQLLNEMNDSLLMIGTVCSVLALIFPPIAPEMVIMIGIMGTISKLISGVSILFYIIDINHALELNNKQRFNEAVEGICWEMVSLIFGGFAPETEFEKIVWNLTGIIDRIFTGFIQKMEGQTDVEYGY